MVKVLLLHYVKRYCFQTLYLGKVCLSLSYFRKNPIKISFWYKTVSPNPIFPALFVQKIKFCDFCEGTCHYNIRDAKYWICGWLLYLVSMFRGDSMLTICTKMNKLTVVHFENLREVATTLPC